MVKVIWSPVARRDLEAIADYIAEDSPARAAVFVDRLIDAAERLATFPRSGRIIPEIGDPNSREMVFGAYRVMYHVEHDAIIIASIVHGARHWPPG
jgi:plasmid stabilization system protein ParE